MARVYISIGSNINAEKNIRLALHVLQQQFGELVFSSVYESEAVGFNGDNFLNLVVALDTDDDVFSVASSLRTIEDNNGRDRNESPFSSRTLDLDLLLYDDAVIHNEKLDIPRDEITKNAFVLWPLAEVAPQQVHPEKKKSIAELWDNFDKKSQRLWPIDFDFMH